MRECVCVCVCVCVSLERICIVGVGYTWLNRAQTTHLPAIVQDEEEARYYSDGHQQAAGVSAARQLFAKC